MQTTLEQPVAVTDELADLDRYMARGGSIQALMDIAEDDLDILYSYGNQLFARTDYAGAQPYYLLLTRLNQWHAPYWLALGLAHQRLGQHLDALAAFVQAGTLQLADPYPPYYAGLSHLLRGETGHAARAFNGALCRCASHAIYAGLREEVQRQADLCTKEATR